MREHLEFALRAMLGVADKEPKAPQNLPEVLCFYSYLSHQFTICTQSTIWLTAGMLSMAMDLFP